MMKHQFSTDCGPLPSRGGASCLAIGLFGLLLSTVAPLQIRADTGRGDLPDISFALAPGLRELTIAIAGQPITVRPEIGQPGKTYPARIWFKDPEMAVPLLGYDQRSEAIVQAYEKHTSDDDQIVRESRVDAEQREIVDTYRWGRITYRYQWDKACLDLEITVHNTSDKSIWQINFPLLFLALSRDSLPAEITEAYFGSPARAYEAMATFQPVVLPLLDGDLALVACSPEQEKPLTLSWLPPKWYQDYRKAIRHDDPVAQELADQHAAALENKGVDVDAEKDVFWRLSLTIGGDKLVEHDRYTTRTIAPGETDAFRVSLRFGTATNPLAPASDILDAFARKHPRLLDWPDRRIILRSFIGDKFPTHFPAGPELTKPDPIEPDEAFRSYVFKSAENLVADAQAVDAQGVIVWNIESPNHRWLGYVGDPRLIEYMCPQMDALADEFFARLRAAGLKTGITLRPRQVGTRRLPAEWQGFKEKYATDSDWIYGATYPRDPDEVVQLLSDMVRYAQKRWGCTLFYIDTNIVSWGPTPEEEAEWPRWTSGNRKGQFIGYRALMNTDQWRQLLTIHPDCLFIPEHGGLLHYAYTMPYSQVNMNATGTPLLISATWPDACKGLAVEARDAGPENYARIVEIFRRRDVVMANPGASNLAELYRDAAFEASLQNLPTPTAMEAMEQADLIRLIMAETGSRQDRLLGARVLLKQVGEDRETVLGTMLQSDDSAIVRLALMAIGDTSDTVFLDRLGEIWVAAFTTKSRQTVRSLVETAIANLGSPAISELAKLQNEWITMHSLDASAVEHYLERLYFFASALAAINTPESLATLDILRQQEQAKPRPLSPYLRYVERILHQAGYKSRPNEGE